jgi:hypothetical protein
MGLNLDLNKKISELNLPFLDVVLEDIFFIPADPILRRTPLPVTIYDLAQACARPGELVWQKLQMVQRLSAGIVLDEVGCRTFFEVDDHISETPLLIDVRFLGPFQNDPVPNAVHLPTMTTDEWHTAFPTEKTAIVFSEDGRKAFSAAMWLREQGRLKCFSTNLAAIRALTLEFAICFFSMFLFSFDGQAVEAEVLDEGASISKNSATEEIAPIQKRYIGQLFVQRPSIKILFGKDDTVEPRANEEVFDSMNYEAESMNAAGLKFVFDNFGLMASRRIGKSDGITTQKFEDYQIVHYTELFGLNLRFQHYIGMIQIMNFKRKMTIDDDTPSETGNRKEYIKRPDASVTHRSGALQYLLYGRNFTMNGAFGEGAPEVRRGFGFPLFLALSRTRFDTGDFLVDDRYSYFFKETSNLNQITTTNGYIGGGAAGMLPFGKFYVSAAASIGLGVQKLKKVYAEYVKTTTDSTAKADLRLVFGFNFREFFAVTTYDLEGTTFRIGEIHATVQSDIISAALGMRF